MASIALDREGILRPVSLALADDPCGGRIGLSANADDDFGLRRHVHHFGGFFLLVRETVPAAQE
jgi:hypothetical protein